MQATQLHLIYCPCYWSLLIFKGPLGLSPRVASMSWFTPKPNEMNHCEHSTNNNNHSMVQPSQIHQKQTKKWNKILKMIKYFPKTKIRPWFLWWKCTQFLNRSLGDVNAVGKLLNIPCREIKNWWPVQRGDKQRYTAQMSGILNSVD